MAQEDTRPIADVELEPLFRGLRSYRRLYLAVSGGVDSTALMHLVARWREAGSARQGESQDPKPEVVVLTVDHGLRPEAADEAALVLQQAEGLGFGAEVLRWTGPKPERGVQEAARTARYQLMLDHIRGGVGCAEGAALVTAHHLGDTAETVLMRLARGGGVDGLAGIQAHSDREGVALLRPLLSLPKTRLQATLQAMNVVWSEDPSNQEPAYERTALRASHSARAELGLDDAALALTAGRMARARRALEAMTSDWLAPQLDDVALRQAGIFIWRRQAAPVLDEIAIRALIRVLPAIGGSGQPLRLLRVERLWNDLQKPDFTGATLGNCMLRPGAEGEVYIYREPHRGVLPETETEPGQDLIWDNRFKVRTENAVLVRGLHQADLVIMGFDPQAARLPYSVDALQSTPVLVDADGLLAIPALNMHRGEGPGTVDRSFTCRFLVDRVNR